MTDVWKTDITPIHYFDNKSIIISTIKQTEFYIYIYEVYIFYFQSHFYLVFDTMLPED